MKKILNLKEALLEIAVFKVAVQTGEFTETEKTMGMVVLNNLEKKFRSDKYYQDETEN